MCGIIGYVGAKASKPFLLEGLERLEYRGYDSAGVSLLEDGRIDSVRAVGNLANLDAALAEREAQGNVATLTREATTGIAHTRWATHGGPTDRNAHPHLSADRSVAVIHNGIIEIPAES